MSLGYLNFIMNNGSIEIPESSEIPEMYQNTGKHNVWKFWKAPKYRKATKTPESTWKYQKADRSIKLSVWEKYMYSWHVFSVDFMSLNFSIVFITINKIFFSVYRSRPVVKSLYRPSAWYTNVITLTCICCTKKDKLFRWKKLWKKILSILTSTCTFQFTTCMFQSWNTVVFFTVCLNHLTDYLH